MKKSCHYGRTKWTAIFDGRSYVFMTTVSMGEAGGMLRPLAGFWFLNNIRSSRTLISSLRFRPLAGVWFLNEEFTQYAASNYNGFRPLAGFWFLNSTVFSTSCCT